MITTDSPLPYIRLEQVKADSFAFYSCQELKVLSLKTDWVFSQQTEFAFHRHKHGNARIMELPTIRPPKLNSGVTRAGQTHALLCTQTCQTLPHALGVLDRSQASLSAARDCLLAVSHDDGQEDQTGLALGYAVFSLSNAGDSKTKKDRKKKKTFVISTWPRLSATCGKWSERAAPYVTTTAAVSHVLTDVQVG